MSSADTSPARGSSTVSSDTARARSPRRRGGSVCATIDPDHRVVARTLEREWNDTLVALEQVEREYHEVKRRETLDLSEDDRTRILALAKDLPRGVARGDDDPRRA